MKRMNKLLTAVLPVIAAAMGLSVPCAFAEDGNITVYVTVEKLSLGEGFVCPPTAVELPEGSTAANTPEAVLGADGYEYNGDIDDGFYLSSVRDDETEPDFPDCIMAAAGKIGQRWSDEWLSEFDYTKQSGWMYSVNNELGASSASDCVLSDGDVVRWQFSIYGYGSDLGFDNTAFGMPPLRSAADKTELIRQTADLRAEYGEEQPEAYFYAMDVLERLYSTDNEIESAIEYLSQYVGYDYSDEEEDHEEEEYTEEEYIEPKSGEERSAELYAAIDATSGYILRNVPKPELGSIGGEWAVIGLSRAQKADGKYFDAYYGRVCDEVRVCDGKLSERKYTEYSRLVIALSALGYNPKDVGGYDIIKPLGDYKRVKLQGVNGPVFALIALDCCGYDMPEDDRYEVRATREMYVDGILSYQNPDGGFSLDADSASGVDITAMTLCALSNYMDNAKVKQAVDRAIAYLRLHQLKSGGFADDGEESAESDAQVITALTSLGISIDDVRFIKNGRTVFDALMRFQIGDGGFSHTIGGEVNEMATEQALYALCAYERSLSGKNRLYDMSDVVKKYNGNELVMKIQRLVKTGDYKGLVEMLRPYLKYLKG